MVSGYKKTKIGLIPEDWDIRLLGEISMPKARIGWQNLRKDEYLDSGFYMLITGTDFSNGRVDYSTCKYVSEERYDQDINIQVGNGDILITKDGTLGKVVLVTGLKMPATLNAGVFVLNNLSSLVNNEFLYHYLSTNRLMKYAERTSTGGTIQHLNQSVLISFPVPVPPLDEQIRIAKVLTDTDDLIIQEERLVTKCQAMKQGCLQHMFPRKGQTEPDMRLPGFTGAWEQRKLGDVADSFEYGLNAAAKEFDGANKYIRITDIDDSTHEFLKTDLTSPDTVIEQADNYKLDEGDILFARTGASVGKTYIYKQSDGLVYYAGFLIRARINKKYDPEFIFQNTLTPDYDKYIRITSQRSGQPGVNAQEYADYELMIPRIDEQKRIGEFLRNLDDLITLHQRKCEKYKMIKQGMMEDLLTGKVRLK